MASQVSIVQTAQFEGASGHLPVSGQDIYPTEPENRKAVLLIAIDALLDNWKIVLGIEPDYYKSSEAGLSCWGTSKNGV